MSAAAGDGGHVAVIDHGKSHVRVLVFDPAGDILAEERCNTPTDDRGPYPAEDVEALHPFVLSALSGFAARFAIDAIVPVAHGAAGALIGGDGLVLPVVDYEGAIPAEIDAAYEAMRPPFGETASPSLPLGLNLGRQLFMQQQRFPEKVAQADAFVPLAQYWAFLLSGVMASEVTSLGAHTDLWDVHRRAPSSLVTGAGWARLFPAVRPAGDTLGPIRPDIARQTGLSPQTRVLTGLHDSNASLVPYLGTAKTPFAVVSSGTWVIVMHVGGSPGPLDPAADMLANVDIFGRPTPSARFMGGREFAALSNDDAPPTLEAARAVIAAGTLALPGFCEQGGPWAHRRGTIVGPVPERPGARASLASLYTALVTDNLLTRLGVKGPVFVDGPLAQNPVWLGAMAALTDGVCPQTGASSAAGAAMLARGVPAAATLSPHPKTLDLGNLRARWMAAITAR
ncbi:MAG: FGGY family carbohydrate kinase [Pseudomonadota bacterium]